MEFIKNYITSITVFVFITTLSLHLIPKSKTKTAAATVFSLILAAVTISPILKINPQQSDILAYIDEYTLNNTSIGNITSRQHDTTASLVTDAMQQQASAILKKHNLDEYAAVKINDTFGIDTITVAEISPEASKEISSFFNIPESAIELRR